MHNLCMDAGLLSRPMEGAITKVCDACDICAKNGRPKNSRKISLTHVNEAFNSEIYVDFLLFTLRKAKRVIMNITDTGTGTHNSTSPPTGA